MRTKAGRSLDRPTVNAQSKIVVKLCTRVSGVGDEAKRITSACIGASKGNDT